MCVLIVLGKVVLTVCITIDWLLFVTCHHGSEMLERPPKLDRDSVCGIEAHAMSEQLINHQVCAEHEDS